MRAVIASRHAVSIRALRADAFLLARCIADKAVVRMLEAVHLPATLRAWKDRPVSQPRAESFPVPQWIHAWTNARSGTSCSARCASFSLPASASAADQLNHSSSGKHFAKPQVHSTIKQPLSRRVVISMVPPSKIKSPTAVNTIKGGRRLLALGFATAITLLCELAWGQAVTLGLKLPAIGGVRSTCTATCPDTNTAPYFHAAADTAGAIDDEQSLVEGVAYCLNLASRVSDPEEDAITFSGVGGAWPDGITPDYNAGTACGTPTTAGMGTVTVRADDGTDHTDQVFSWTVSAASDSVAPTVPGTPQLVERAETTATISWAASADPSGIDHYNIYRAQGACSQGFNKTLLGTSATTTYQHTGRNSTDSKCYAISAVDGATNESAQSGELNSGPYVAPPVADLIFEQDFEALTNGQTTFSGLNLTISTNGTGTPTVSTTTAHGGTKSLRNQVIRSGGASNYRSELRINAATDNEVSQGQEMWTGFAVRLAAPYESDDLGNTVFQWHQPAPPHPDDDADTITQPMLIVQVMNGRWQVTKRWAACQPTTNSCKNHLTYDLGPYTADQWVEWVIHIVWDWTSAGELEVWKDGTKVVDVSGAIGYNNSRAAYAKFGLYIPAYQNNDGPDRTVYHDSIKVADESGSYEAVAP